MVGELCGHCAVLRQGIGQGPYLGDQQLIGGGHLLYGLLQHLHRGLQGGDVVAQLAALAADPPRGISGVAPPSCRFLRLHAVVMEPLPAQAAPNHSAVVSPIVQAVRRAELGHSRSFFGCAVICGTAVIFCLALLVFDLVRVF